jgi:hypothetical protein
VDERLTCMQEVESSNPGADQFLQKPDHGTGVKFGDSEGDIRI